MEQPQRGWRDRGTRITRCTTSTKRPWYEEFMCLSQSGGLTVLWEGLGGGFNISVVALHSEHDCRLFRVTNSIDITPYYDKCGCLARMYSTQWKNGIMNNVKLISAENLDFNVSSQICPLPSRLQIWAPVPGSRLQHLQWQPYAGWCLKCRGDWLPGWGLLMSWP